MKKQQKLTNDEMITRHSQLLEELETLMNHEPLNRDDIDAVKKQLTYYETLLYADTTSEDASDYLVDGELID